MAIQFKNKNGLELYTKLQQKKKALQEGELAYIVDTNTTYRWNNNQWEEIKIKTDNDIVEMTLYDMNAQIIKQLPNHDDTQIQEDITLINTFDKDKQARYYMLLCKEYNYYTIFNYVKTWGIKINRLGENVIDCLNNVGTIRACDYDNITNPTAIELWVSIDDDTVHCFHLFPYDVGIVEFSREAQ